MLGRLQFPSFNPQVDWLCRRHKTESIIPVVQVVPRFGRSLCRGIEHMESHSLNADHTLMQISAKAHNEARQDEYMCAGSSTNALGDAFQTTLCESFKREYLSRLLQQQHDVQRTLRHWVDEHGLELGDAVLYHELDGSCTPAVVIGVDPYIASYTVRCEYSSHDNTEAELLGVFGLEQPAHRQSRTIETVARKLSLVERKVAQAVE